MYLYFFHLENDVRSLLSEGQIIKPGMQLGKVGSSGNSKYGVHLHFEVRTEVPGDTLHNNRHSAVNPSFMLGAFAHGTVTADRYYEYNRTDEIVAYIPGRTDGGYGGEGGFGDYDSKTKQAR